jgi:hypothetical protein
VDAGADAEIDIIRSGTALAEFYRLSVAALGPPTVHAKALTSEQANALVDRPTQADFLGCGFSFTSASGVGVRPKRSDPHLISALEPPVGAVRLGRWGESSMGRCDVTARASLDRARCHPLCQEIGAGK